MDESEHPAGDLQGKIPPVRKTRAALSKAHKAHLKAQEADESEGRLVKQPILLEGYPASAISIRDLDIIPLSELKIETHHRGYGIIVKTIAAPFRGAGTVTLVQDEHGNVDKISIYNQGDSSILSNIPEGCVIAVKEPYYKYSDENDYLICVDHPSDVILLRFNDPIIPGKLKAGAEAAMTKPAADWRSVGDAAFIARDFPTAVFCYTEALDGASEEGDAFKAAVFAKRAGTNLMLGRYDAAKEDALASRNGTDADWRAYFTAAKAAYGLCEYPESRVLFESALKLKPKMPNLQKEYKRCLARLHEAEGNYDFAAMLATVNPDHVHLDHASFLSNTVVKHSELHGNGLFAARDIKAGDLLFVEKATIMPNQYIPLRASASLYANMVLQLYNNPSLASQVLGLYGGEYARSGAEGTIVDGVPVVDVFLVEGIRLKNCFSCPISSLEETKPSSRTGERQAKGLWRQGSYLNHSCVPNSMRSFMGDMFLSRASRDIPAGDEIFQQYVPVRADLDSRQERFSGWGFACGCALCAREKLAPADGRAKRLALLFQIEKFGNKREAVGVVPDAAIRTMERMARQLEAMHEPEVYGEIPRLTLVFANMWLTRAHRGRKNHAKVVAFSMQVLRNFGFFVPVNKDGSYGDVREVVKNPGPVSLMTIHVVSVIKFSSEAYRAMGKRELADQFLEAATWAYMVMTGFENDVSAIDED